ncbi:MAG TPA: ATP-binding protein [Anaerolineae bacterium]|nr:ATP-binding protein [Anaerolineae bacterium]
MIHWQYTPYVLPLVIAAALSAALALFVVRRRRFISGAVPFVLLMLAIVWWSLGYALELGSAALAAKIFWAKVQYLSIVTVPIAWLACALQYTGRGRWLTSRNLILLAIEPFVTLLLVWTNDVHRLFYSSTGLDASGSFSALDLAYGPWFWVRDNGSGLTPEEQARLFAPFTQLGQARTKGQGLGLSIVRRIVEKLGGQVGVESEVGQGSVFTFTLPGARQ